MNNVPCYGKVNVIQSTLVTYKINHKIATQCHHTNNQTHNDQGIKQKKKEELNNIIKTTFTNIIF